MLSILFACSLCLSTAIVTAHPLKAKYSWVDDTMKGVSRRALSEPNLPDYEISALYDLYNSTKGPEWIWTPSKGEPWVFADDVNPCVEEWQGVTCSSNETVLHVLNLYLDGMRLSGKLPESLGNFTELLALSLNSNAISGSIPETLYNCTTLMVLDLSDNVINGTLSERVYHLPALEYLALQTNHMTGYLPENLLLHPTLATLDLGSNHFKGCPPDSVAVNSSLQYFVFKSNRFHCTIPAAYGWLPNVNNMDMSDNFFYGTIPSAFFTPTTTPIINFNENLLTGTIPVDLGVVSGLTELLVADNFLTGTFPAILTQQSQMVSIDLSDNFLTGTIPAGLGTLRDLRVLYTYQNHMTGTIPADLGNCTSMYYFIINTNYYTGTLPASLGQWSTVAYFEVQQNLFSGPLPAEYGNLRNAYLIDIAHNSFTGTLPTTFSALSEVAFFVFDNNFLSGTIAESIFAGMTNIYQLNIGANAFTGTVPSSLGSVPRLQYCNFFSNEFTGTLPESIGNLDYLQFLFFYENRLTGPIPNSYGGLVYIEQLYLNANYISGTIPEALCSVLYVQFFDLGDNFLSGTVPKVLSNTYYLLSVMLDNNFLSGNLDGLFNHQIQLRLLTIVLNNNKFTGTIPGEVFRLPSLNSFTAVNNCLQGTIPSEVCQARMMVSFSLDGASSAKSCRKTLFPGVLKSYVAQHPLEGTIPACLFALPLLTTLHLSGNAHTGALADVSENSYLVDLSLSHNALTGTIPPTMQARRWYNLDLAYNRISGSLLSNFQTQYPNATFFARIADILNLDFNLSSENAPSSLSLETNRLSGRIPQSVLHRHNVSILGSNVFSCDATESNLPQHDSGRSTYECGSDSFNVPFYLWLSLVCISATLCLTVWRYREEVEKRLGIEYAVRHVMKWVKVLEDHSEVLGGTRLQAYRKVLELAAVICRSGMWCTAYCLLVLMPIYLACSHFHGTLLHQYAWTLSAAYTEGWVSTILMMVFLTGLVVVTLVNFMTYSQRLSAERSTPESLVPSVDTTTPSVRGTKAQAVLILIYALFMVINLVVVIGVNTAYVVAAIYGRSEVLFPAQLALSCFKLLWNRFFSVYLIRWTARLRTLAGITAPAAVAGVGAGAVAGTSELTEEGADQAAAEAQTAEADFVLLQMVVALLNNIAVPCLVVAGVSPSCFYNLFVVAPDVSATYTYQACGFVSGATCLFFIPGYIYTSYTPPFTYNYQCSSSFITYYAPTFVLLCLLRACASPLLQFTLYHLHRRSSPGTQWNALLDSVLLPNLKSIVPGQAARRDVFKPFFDANQLVLSLFTYTGLLLTFGAVFPPVALALLTTLLAVFYFNKLKVSRFLCRAVEQEQLDYVDVVEAESARAGFLPVLERAVWMLITVSCWFYTLFLFDTLGDAVGFKGAYWVLIVMPLMPVVLYLISSACKALLLRPVLAPSQHSMDTAGAEMTSIGVETKSTLHADNL